MFSPDCARNVLAQAQCNAMQSNIYLFEHQAACPHAFSSGLAETSILYGLAYCLLARGLRSMVDNWRRPRARSPILGRTKVLGWLSGTDAHVGLMGMRGYYQWFQLVWCGRMLPETACSDAKEKWCPILYVEIHSGVTISISLSTMRKARVMNGENKSVGTEMTQSQ